MKSNKLKKIERVYDKDFRIGKGHVKYCLIKKGYKNLNKLLNKDSKQKKQLKRENKAINYGGILGSDYFTQHILSCALA